MYQTYDKQDTAAFDNGGKRTKRDTAAFDNWGNMTNVMDKIVCS